MEFKYRIAYMGVIGYAFNGMELDTILKERISSGWKSELIEIMLVEKE